MRRNGWRLWTVVLLLRSAVGAAKLAILKAQPPSDLSQFVGVFGAFGGSAPEGELDIAVPPEEDSIGCSSYQLPLSTRKVISLVQRGNCTFVDKALNAQEAGAAGILVAFDTDQVAEMGGSNSSAEDQKVRVFAVAIGKSMGDKISKHLRSLPPEPVVVSVTAYEPSVMNVSEFILILIATGLVAAGTVFSTADMRQTGFGSAIAPQAEEVQEVDTVMAGSFCIVGSAMLVFLFFFMKYMIYVIMFSFCVGGALCLAQFIAMSLHHYVPRLKHRLFDLPQMGPVTEAECIAAVPAVALAMCWFVLRNTQYGWPFQDIIGAGFLCWMQRTLRLPNLKTATVLLTAMFFFDIYWVFISVHQFKQSVMVSVATGAGTGESVPMLIRIPQFGDPLGGDRMLGFGDIALPGLLVSYLRRHDLTSHRTFWEGYFAPSLLGYFCGLCVTIAALSIMKMGQPALLYLVPGTLGTTVLLSLCRGELQLLWDGLPARGSRRLEEGGANSDVL
ncbi:SPPL3 [Symbiodinium sp. CCMP2592]|nr:SPPL3 [Symbiodinium sp. CCMP2592]